MTDREKNKQIRQARPKLKIIAPLTNWVIIAYIILNMFVAMSLATTMQPIRNPIVFGGVGRYAWAVIFAFLGFHLLYGKLTNNWEMIKRNFIVGLITKTLWMYALLYLTYIYGWRQYLGILGLWLAVMLIQYGAVVVSIPKVNTKELPHVRPDPE